MTTMTCRAATRDLVVAAARNAGMTVDDYLSYLLDEVAWQQRLNAAAVAMAHPDPEDLDEVAGWDALGDGSE